MLYDDVCKIRLIIAKLDVINAIYNTMFLILILKTSLIINLKDDNLQVFNKNHNIIEYIKLVQSILSKKYNLFNKEININDKELLDIVKYIHSDNEIIDYKNLINNIFEIYFTNENLLDIKDYIKYYNNPLFSEWIIKIANNQKNESVFDGNVKINSYLDFFKNNNKFGLQTNDYIYDIILIQNFIKNDLKLDNIINVNIINDSIQVNNLLFDTIYFDFPTDVHNIIYKQCCDQIKNLKIRGTNSHCLLLQLISLYMNYDGEAVLIIPEQLLFNNSKQNIETRKYIFSNFNIEKIIHIDQKIYYNNINRDLKSITNTIKNCVFYFKNSGKTTIINISKISLDNNSIIETQLFKIDNINDEFSFYYKDYLNSFKNNNFEIDHKNVNEIFTICDTINEKDLTIFNMNNMIILNKNYHTTESIKIINNIKYYINNHYLIYEKDKMTNYYYTYYLENVIKKNPESFIKGKNNQIDLTKILEYKIPIIPIHKQNSVCSYIINSNKIINSNDDNITMYNTLISSMLDNIQNDNMIILDKVVNIIQEETGNKTISVMRNSLSAGEVSLYQGKLNNNSYYLVPKDNKFILEYIYYYLKYKENHIKEMSKLTQQYNLIKSNLLNFKIPNINTTLQNKIVSYCEEFDNNINLLILNNNVIKNKDIFNIIAQINSY